MSIPGRNYLDPYTVIDDKRPQLMKDGRPEFGLKLRQPASFKYLPLRGIKRVHIPFILDLKHGKDLLAQGNLDKLRPSLRLRYSFVW